MSVLSILIDSREPDWVQSLTFGGISTAVAQLDSGDILMACDDGSLLAVERKTPTDFLNTLGDERLFAQMAGIRNMTPWAYLVITGHLFSGPSGRTYTDNRDTGWNWASVVGALTTVQEMGVVVINIAGDHDLEAALLRLAARDRSTVRIAPPRDTARIGTQEAILMSLPGIGLDKAQALIEYCGSAAWAICCLTMDRGKDAEIAPSGIAAATKQKVRKALGLHEWAELHLYSRDGVHLKVEDAVEEQRKLALLRSA